MARPPVTQVRTSHALTIKANGITIGMINGWAPTQSRTITPIFEVGSDDSGNPAELAPGNIQGQQIAVSRFDTYKDRMEMAFGTPDLMMLTRQTEPFDVIERWVVPNDQLAAANPNVTPFIDEERFLYQSCWFSNLGRTLRSDDNRLVNVSATLVYTKRLKLTGLSASAFGIRLPI